MLYRLSILGLLVIETLIPSQASCQSNLHKNVFPPQATEDQVAIRFDSSVIHIDRTTYRYLNMMDSLDRSGLRTNGYRIQIYSASGPNARKDALEKQAEFLKVYQKSSAYTKWIYPNWVVRLGDYRTQLEALEFHNEVRTLFPASFIVKDEIKVN